MLIPQIETPTDDSELHAPSIGHLIAERIKYNKVRELNIVKIEGPQKSLKSLISRMTFANPEERLSAGEVLALLDKLESTEIHSEGQV